MKIRLSIILVIILVFSVYNYAIYTIISKNIINPLDILIQVLFNALLIYLLYKLPTLNN